MCETDVEWHLNEVSTRWSIDNLLGAFVTRDAMHIRGVRLCPLHSWLVCSYRLQSFLKSLSSCVLSTGYRLLAIFDFVLYFNAVWEYYNKVESDESKTR